MPVERSFTIKKSSKIINHADKFANQYSQISTEMQHPSKSPVIAAELVAEKN